MFGSNVFFWQKMIPKYPEKTGRSRKYRPIVTFLTISCTMPQYAGCEYEERAGKFRARLWKSNGDFHVGEGEKNRLVWFIRVSRDFSGLQTTWMCHWKRFQGLEAFFKCWLRNKPNKWCKVLYPLCSPCSQCDIYIYKIHIFLSYSPILTCLLQVCTPPTWAGWGFYAWNWVYCQGGSEKGHELYR